jgi:hypothetical protein
MGAHSISVLSPGVLYKKEAFRLSSWVEFNDLSISLAQSMLSVVLCVASLDLVKRLMWGAFLAAMNGSISTE